MRATNLKKSFKQFSLDINSLEIPQQICGLIGGNGCGKTTTINILAGLTKPDSGEISHNFRTQEITLVPQKPYMMRDTVLANLLYPLKLHKIAPDAAKIEELLHLANLQDLRNAHAPSLSAGESQKLALIRALIFEPKIIFLDEIFSNMDMESQTAFEQYILQQQNKNPITWVIISHQLSAIKRLCSHIIYMEKGRIVEEGGDILQYPQTAGLQKFLEFNYTPQP